MAAYQGSVDDAWVVVPVGESLVDRVTGAGGAACRYPRF
jgi:hypothetical protein